MNRMASFLFQPIEGLPISVYNLASYKKTRQALELSEDIYSRTSWREGYYLPNGKVVCNTFRGDPLTGEKCEKSIKAKFPTFVDFLNFAFERIGNTYEGNLNLNLSKLTSLKGIKLPKTIKGHFSLTVTSTKDLKLPKSMEGSLSLYGVKSAKGLKFPKFVRCSLFLDELTSAEGLELPKYLNGSLGLHRLTSAKGLKLPKTINGNLYLPGLTSAKDLELPKTIRGVLWLNGLKSLKDLKLSGRQICSVVLKKNWIARN